MRTAELASFWSLLFCPLFLMKCQQLVERIQHYIENIINLMQLTQKDKGAKFDSDSVYYNIVYFLFSVKEQGPIRNIITGQVFTDDTCDDTLQMETIGKHLYNEFVMIPFRWKP